MERGGHDDGHRDHDSNHQQISILAVCWRGYVLVLALFFPRKRKLLSYMTHLELMVALLGAILEWQLVAAAVRDPRRLSQTSHGSRNEHRDGDGNCRIRHERNLSYNDSVADRSKESGMSTLPRSQRLRR